MASMRTGIERGNPRTGIREPLDSDFEDKTETSVKISPKPIDPANKFNIKLSPILPLIGKRIVSKMSIIRERTNWTIS